MAYRSSSTNQGTNNTPSVTVPTGAAINDIMILVCSVDNVNDVFAGTWPTGFTQFDDVNLTLDGQSVGVAWKRLTAADTGSYTLTSIGTAGQGWIMQCVCVSGRSTSSNPARTVATNNSSNSSPVSVSASTITALAGDDLVWIGAPDVLSAGVGNGMTPPSGYTERQDFEDGSGWTNLSMATRDNVAAGATGTVTGTFTMTGSTSGWAAWLVRLPAAAGGTGYTQALTGALSFTGSHIKSPQKRMTAGLSFTGSLGRAIGRKLTAGLSFAGNLKKLTLKTPFTGGLSFTGLLTKGSLYFRSFTAGLSFSGNLLRGIAYSRVFTAVLSFTGAIQKNTSRRLTGSLSFTGAFRKLSSKALAGGLSFTGALRKRAARSFTGGLSFSGLLLNGSKFFRSFTASLSFTGLFRKQANKRFTGGLSFVGSIARRRAKVFTAGLSFTGNLKKQTRRKFTANFSFTGFFQNYIAPKFIPLTAIISSLTNRATESSKTNIADVDTGATISDVDSLTNRADVSSEGNDTTLQSDNNERTLE